MSHWNSQYPPPLPPRSPRPPPGYLPGSSPGYSQAPYFPAPPTASAVPPPIPPRPTQYQRTLSQHEPGRQPASSLTYSTPRDSSREFLNRIDPSPRSPGHDAAAPPAVPPRPPSCVPSPSAPAPRHFQYGPNTYAPNQSGFLQPQTTTVLVGASHTGFWDSGAYPQPDSTPQNSSPVTSPQHRLSTSASRLADGSGPSIERGGETSDIDQLLRELEISTDGSQRRNGAHEYPPRGSTENVNTPTAPVQASGAVTGKMACINVEVEFPAMWYSHTQAPGMWICSRCYDQHMRGTPIAREFGGRFYDDHQARGCSFNSARIKDVLLKNALRMGSAQQLVDHYKFRATVPGCKGVIGVKGSENIKWFTAKDNAIPGFVACQACWEDHVLSRRFSAKFEPVSMPHAENDIWACDMAVPYIRKQYTARADADDWSGFVREASDRLKLPACPKTQKAPLVGRSWVCPIERPQILICGACFCDHVLGSGEEEKWRDSTGDKSVEYATDVVCATGQFTLNLAMSCAEDQKDYSIFWNALEAALQNQACVSGGMKGASWYTPRSDPRDFGVCGGCYEALIGSLRLTKFFIPKIIPADLEYRCCLNPEFPRFATYLVKLLEAYYAEDTTALEVFAAAYTHLPVCRRDQDYKNGLWYGWPDCTICVECHHEFIRGTALADSMPYQGVRVEGSIMCDMYSPRMRGLYLEACATNPPDPSALRAYAAHRSQVYVQTMMVIRQIQRQQRLALGEQMRLNRNSSFYNWLGNSQAASMGSTGSWSAVGVGYGFQNQNQLLGARYGQQAIAAGAGVGSGAGSIQALEQQWREVE